MMTVAGRRSGRSTNTVARNIKESLTCHVREHTRNKRSPSDCIPARASHCNTQYAPYHKLLAPNGDAKDGDSLLRHHFRGRSLLCSQVVLMQGTSACQKTARQAGTRFPPTADLKLRYRTLAYVHPLSLALLAHGAGTMRVRVPSFFVSAPTTASERRRRPGCLPRFCR